MTSVRVTIGTIGELTTTFGDVPVGQYFFGRVLEAGHGLYYRGRNFVYRVDANDVSWTAAGYDSGRKSPGLPPTFNAIPVRAYLPVIDLVVRAEQ